MLTLHALDGAPVGTFSHPFLSQRVWLGPVRALGTRSGTNGCNCGTGSSPSHYMSSSRASWSPPHPIHLTSQVQSSTHPINHSTNVIQQPTLYNSYVSKIENINNHMGFINYNQCNEVNHCADSTGTGWGTRRHLISPNSFPASLFGPSEGPGCPIRYHWVQLWDRI